MSTSLGVGLHTRKLDARELQLRLIVSDFRRLARLVYSDGPVTALPHPLRYDRAQLPRSAAGLIALAVLVWMPAVAGAQGASPEAPQPIAAGWQDGLVVQSADGDFRLQIGLLLQFDGRFVLDDAGQAPVNTFALSRARPSVRGRLARRFEFFVNPDFGGGTVVLLDAYMDTVVAPSFRIRIGKGKTPFGLERLHSASNLLFLSRAMPTSLVPNRDVGIQILGDVSGGVLSYMAGIMNGVPDGGSADLDTNSAKDLSGRLIVRPFGKAAASPLKGLSLAVSGSSGRQADAAALPTFRTRSIQQQFFSYEGASADGVRTRYSPQVSYYYKVFGGFAEYVRTELPILKGGESGHIAHQAWQVAASVVLSGETATDAPAGVRPRANADFEAGHFGALQIAVRYHTLNIDARAFARNLAAAGSNRKAAAWTAGLNWYLTPNFKYVVDLERTVFDGDPRGPRRPEDAVVFRGQLAF